MKSLSYSIACAFFPILVAACASTYEPQSHSLYPQSPDFTGEYRFKYPSNESLILKCTSNTQCNMSFTSPTGEQTGRGTNYANATPIKDASQLQFAFEYAQQHRSAPSATDEDKHTIKALAPLLDQKDYRFNNCIDLNPEEMPQYLVVCKPQSTPWAKPTVFLFGTLIAGTCGEPFCRYVIIPLHAKTSP